MGVRPASAAFSPMLIGPARRGVSGKFKSMALIGTFLLNVYHISFNLQIFHAACAV